MNTHSVSTSGSRPSTVNPGLSHAMQKLLSTASSLQRILPGNVLWALLFCWWLALASFVVAGILFVVATGGRDYATPVYGLGWYIFWPFGKYARSAVIFRPKARILVRILVSILRYSRPSNSPTAPRLSSSRRSTLLRYRGMVCSSPVRRKEQKLNSKSTGVTRTMLIMAVFGTLTPPLFYQTCGNVRIFLSVRSLVI